MGPEIRQYIPNSKSFDYSDAVVAEKRIRAIDYDPERKFLYWTDTSLRTIKRAVLPDNTKGVGQPQDLEIRGIEEPNGIAFDWVAK